MYHVSDEVLLESLVNNDTGNTMIRDAKLRITVTGPGMRIVFTTKGKRARLGAVGATPVVRRVGPRGRRGGGLPGAR
ncbi:MAG: hypothetical protein U5L11_17685 [Arhodomonas sp.]|nr:hypothetical protein [Arhodomonas sp.]